MFIALNVSSLNLNIAGWSLTPSSPSATMDDHLRCSPTIAPKKAGKQLLRIPHCIH